MWRIFTDEYLPNPESPWGRLALLSVNQESTVGGETAVVGSAARQRQEITLHRTGNGPIAAFCNALSHPRTSTSGCWTTPSTPCPPVVTPTAASYLECAIGDRVLWGVGIDPSIVTSSLKAIVSAVNRAERLR